MTRTRQIILVGLLVFAALGCGSGPETAPVAEAPEERGPVATPDDQPGEESTEGPALAAAEHDAKAADDIPLKPRTEATAIEYSPPFPDRTELFVMPKRQGGAVQGDYDDSVQLIGFARLDEQQALISFNGEVSPLPEGAQHYGVEVISIKPPKVVLQRGRQRWQASLQN